MEKKTQLRPKKYFSEAVKKQVVKDIEQGLCTVLRASQELCVHQTTIYPWIYKYSRYLQRNRIMVVQEKSEAYQSKELEKRIQELEASLGRKQLEIELLNKVIELANDEYKTDLKKNLQKKP